MLKKIKNLFLSDILLKLSNLLFTIAVARMFGASILGIIVLYTSIISLTQLASRLGLFITLEKKISESKNNYSILMSNTLILNSLFLIFVIIIILPLNNMLENYVGIEDFIIPLIGSLITGNFIYFAFAILRGTLRFNEFSLLKMLRGTTFYLSSIIVLIIFNDPLSVVWTKFIIETLILIASLLFIKGIKFDFTGINKGAMRDLLVLTRYNAVLEVRALTFNWADVWMIGYFLNENAVGIYQVAWQISTSILIFGKAFITYNFPFISKLFAQNKISEIQEAYNKLLNMVLLLPIPIFMGGLLFSETIMYLFGEDFTDGSNILIILLLCSIFRGIQESSSKTLVAIDQAVISYRVSIFGGILNVILNYLLIQSLGLVGAALATLLSTLVITVIMIFSVLNKLKSKFKWKFIIYNIFSSIIMVVVIFLIDFVTTVNDILYILLGVFVWGLIMFAIRVKSKI